MPHVKSAILIQMRKLLSADPEKEAHFLKTLPVQFHEVYEKTKPNQWVAIDVAAELYSCGAKVLFPDDPEPLIKLGQTVAENLYGGIYAFFFRIPTIDFAMKHSVNIWYLFHDTGRYGYENFTGHSIDICAKNYPELPLATRTLIIGHIKVIFKLIGVKINVIEMITDDPNNWRWHIEFERNR